MNQLNQPIKRLVSRAAMTLLLCVLTTASAWADTVTANYMNADGTTGSHSATVINQSNMPTKLGTNGTESWYVVTENVSYTSQIQLRGDVHLILGNGKTMNFGTEDNPIDFTAIDWAEDKATLTIYGATADSGTLKIYLGNSSSLFTTRGIYLYKSYTQNSGNVIIKSIGESADNCILADDFIMNGGKLDVTSTKRNAIMAWETATINGGSIIATTEGTGIYAGKGITINGGNISGCGYDVIYC